MEADVCKKPVSAYETGFFMGVVCKTALFAYRLVEVPGFEPGLAEPKSVVLPLHHTSIPGCKDTKIIF